MAPRWLFWFFVIVVITVVVGTCTIVIEHPARARDLGQWEENSPEVKRWFQSLMQPDTINVTPGYGGTSCCGEGDGYWADEQHVRDGKVFAVITDERPDDKLMRMHEDVGKEYEVPQKKIVGMEQRVGNPTGHTIIFLGVKQWLNENTYRRPVLCFVMNGGV